MTGHRVEVAFAVALLLACRAPRPAPATAAHGACEPPTGELEPGVTSETMAGEYRLELVATEGPRAGAATDGALRLVARPDSLRQPPPVLGIRDSTTTLPLSGSADLDVAAVGAVSPGAAGSNDPLAPGVLVLERRGGSGSPLVLLRMGSEANRPGVTRFDGGYLALTVRELGDSGFRGTWASAGGPGAQPTGASAGGHFCAVRIQP
jgi:hypothetical protein